MRDISAKRNTLRIAVAEAILSMKQESVDAVQNNTGPKPDIEATARASSFLAVKNTPGAIPHCHPIPVEAVRTDFFYGEGEIRISVTVTSIYKTGCEIEAMHGASNAALVVYDMMKPVDKEIEVSGIRLLRKSGGKSDRRDMFKRTLTAGLVVCSDTVSEGKKEDRAGGMVKEKLAQLGLETVFYTIVPDEVAQIQQAVQGLIEQKVDLILTCGGTGLSARDKTPEAVLPLIETEVPGIMEAAREYGGDRTPFAMLSRGVAGIASQSLIITLPGSTTGAAETMDALFPQALHIFKVLEHGYRH